jgi:hypothetical protein
MAEVSPITTHEAGAGPDLNNTEIMRPKDACAREAGVDLPIETATPSAISRTTLKNEPQR